MATKTRWELSARHEWPVYAKTYARFRRMHIPDILAKRHAEDAWLALSGMRSWNTVVNLGPAVIHLTDGIKEQLSEAQSELLDRSINVAAARSYQFRFDNHRLSERGEPCKDPDHPLAPFVDFVNSPRFLAAMRQLTGRPDIAFADAQATRYGPGQFLHVHDDIDGPKKRIAAYVLNLTHDWSAEWGGILNFLDEDGHVAEGYVPRFNALNVFDVGVPHFVSYVAPYAEAPRLSITGWLRGR